MKKLNNKGFSMVELIIVIAIMAILVGAIAPTLIKYIKKSRRSADLNNGQTIAAAFQEAAANPDAADGLPTSVTTYKLGDFYASGGAVSTNFDTEFKSILGTAPKVKLVSGTADYYIKYDPSNNSVVVFANTTNTDANHVYPDASGVYSSN